MDGYYWDDRAYDSSGWGDIASATIIFVIFIIVVTSVWSCWSEAPRRAAYEVVPVASPATPNLEVRYFPNGTRIASVTVNTRKRSGEDNHYAAVNALRSYCSEECGIAMPEPFLSVIDSSQPDTFTAHVFIPEDVRASDTEDVKLHWVSGSYAAAVPFVPNAPVQQQVHALRGAISKGLARSFTPLRDVFIAEYSNRGSEMWCIVKPSTSV